MKNNLKIALVAAGLAGLAAVPFIAKADGINFKVKIGDDNEAHYHFRDRRVQHDPEMLRAAQSLAEAKNHLWYAKNDFGGHRSSAVQHINMALDEINAAENSRRDDRR
jgi:hypothetical protein